MPTLARMLAGAAVLLGAALLHLPPGQHHCLVAEAATVRWLAASVEFQQHVKDGWEAETGHTLEFHGVEGDVNPFIDQDLDTDHFFDVFSASTPFAPWYEKGLIQDLTDVVKDPAFDWQGVTIAGRRNQATYDGKVGAVPIDTDNYMLYYRRDLIAAVPSTWEDLIRLTTEWAGRDITGDGVPDYPICLNGDNRFNDLLWSILVSLAKYKPGFRQGYVWDVADDDSEEMRPLFQSAAWRKAFELAGALWNNTGFPGGRSIVIGTLYGVFAEGRCLTYLSFPSAGTQVVKATGADQPPLFGNLGVSRAPGTKTVLDRETDTMVACDLNLCPSMESGGINRNTFITGGAAMSIPLHNTENLEATIGFMAYISRNADVRLASGINPFRSRHFNATWFLEAPTPWDRFDAELYTSAIQAAMESEGSIGVIRVPTSQIIKDAMNNAFKKYMRQAGTPYENISAAESDLTVVLRQLEAEVDENTVAAGFTKLDVEQAYRKSLSLPPYVPKEEELSVVLIVLIVVLVVVVVVAGVVVASRFVGKNGNAPKNPTAPIAIVFVGPRNLGTLQGTDPEAAGAVLQHFNDAVKRLTRKHGCYTVKRLADTVLIVGNNLRNATACATAIVQEASMYRRVPLVRRGPPGLLGKSQTDANSSGISPISSHHSSGRTTSARSKGSTTRSTLSRRSTTAASRVSKSTAADGYRVGVRRGEAGVSFSGGVHVGPCLIHHDEEREVYDYSGANIEVAALVADAALPSQLLVSAEVVAGFDELESGPPVELNAFRTITVKGESKAVHAVVAAGLPKLAVPKANESGPVENVDSIMAALEQSNGGVTRKRITVLVVRIVGLKEKAEAMPRDKFSETYVRLSQAMAEVLETHRGYLVSLMDGHAVVTFNAVHPTPNQVARASSCALTLAEELQVEFGTVVRCGLATGMAYVGTQATHQALVSSLCSQATALSVLCVAHSGVPCLATELACMDVATSIYTQSLDYIVLPQSTEPVAIGALMAFRGNGNADGEDEWLYELAQADKADPFAGTNKLFKRWLSGADPNEIQVQLAEHTMEVCGAAAEFLRQVVASPEMTKKEFAQQRALSFFGALHFKSL